MNLHLRAKMQKQAKTTSFPLEINFNAAQIFLRIFPKTLCFGMNQRSSLGEPPMKIDILSLN